MAAGSILIYGANGYTGRLMALRAGALGLSPILAGRNADSLRILARETGLPTRVFGLDDAKALCADLSDIDVVIHAAGPFAHTAAPMIDACVATGTHYLDITGELEQFKAARAWDQRARRAGVVILPGIGFDVAPSDCLALQLHQRLPSATHLVLAMSVEWQISRGTALTIFEDSHRGSAVRCDGELKRVPAGGRTRNIRFSTEEHHCVAVPSGDLVTVFHSTGVPNIEVYFATPPATVRTMRFIHRCQPVLRWSPVASGLRRLIAAKVRGADEAQRAHHRAQIWGELCDDEGRCVQGELHTPDPYDLTADLALESARRLLGTPGCGPGFHTPATAFGADYVLQFGGVCSVQ